MDHLRLALRYGATADHRIQRGPGATRGEYAVGCRGADRRADPCRTVLPASRGRGRTFPESYRRRRCGGPCIRGGQVRHGALPTVPPLCTRGRRYSPPTIRAPKRMGHGSAVVLVLDPATALPCLLLGDLALPHCTRALRSGELLAFGHLSSGPRLSRTRRRPAPAALRLAR